MTADLNTCNRCGGSGYEKSPDGTPRLGAPTCHACFGSGKSDGVRALQVTNHIYGERAAMKVGDLKSCRMRRFELHRDEDVSGVSGTGVVAEGVAFSDGGPVALRWTSEWPTSVVFHDRGIESLEAVHGHNGRTRIVWLDKEA